jgi:hypothetical protein
MHGVTAEHILNRVKKLCNQCNELPHESDNQATPYAAFRQFCKQHMPQHEEKPISNPFPVIESKDLITELEGQDLGEFPCKEEIGIYRKILNDLRTIADPSLQHIIDEHMLLIDLIDAQPQRMFTTTASKNARTLFGSAYVGQSNIDTLFDNLSKSKIKAGAYLQLEEAYVATADIFIKAHEEGYPNALEKVIKTIILDQRMETITRWKAHHEKDLSEKSAFNELCRTVAQLHYFGTEMPTAEAVYCHAQLAQGDILPLFKQPKNTHDVHASNILYEQACYVIAHKLIEAHDRGHQNALKDAEELMGSQQLLTLVEQQKKRKLPYAETEFATVWKKISQRKYHTQPIAEAQHIAASSSNQHFETVAPSSSTDTYGPEGPTHDHPPRDELKG